jgi:hypothetical protein
VAAIELDADTLMQPGGRDVLAAGDVEALVRYLEPAWQRMRSAGNAPA